MIDAVVLKEKISDVYYNVRRFVVYDLQYIPGNIAISIRNLIKWFPVIWKDRDWDHSFIYEILKHKLENQAHYIAKKNRHTSAKRDAELMLLCARLIEIQQEELYDMEYLDYREIEWTDDLRIIRSKMVSDNLEDYLAKYPRQYKRLLNGEITTFGHTPKQELIDNKEMASIIIAHENQDRSRRLLFKLLERNIERWWD
jgi:hypothetical protein